MSTNSSVISTQLALRQLDRETAVRLASRFVPGYVAPPIPVIQRPADRPGHFRKNGSTAKLLRLLKKAPQTAKELAARSGINPTTVSSILTKQEQAGVLKRDGTRSIKGSREMIVYAIA